MQVKLQSLANARHDVGYIVEGLRVRCYGSTVKL